MPTNLDEIWKDGQESREPSLDSQVSEGPEKAELSLLSIRFVSLLINGFFIFLIIKEQIFIFKNFRLFRKILLKCKNIL